MPKSRVFVVPVDFSPEMEATVSAVGALAKRCEAQVHVLAIAPAARPSLLGGGDLRFAHRRSHGDDWSRLEEVIRSTQRQRVLVRAILYRGEPLRVIASHAQLKNARLIVVNQHYGTSRWRRTTSVVHELARSAPVPVLALPAGHKRTIKPASFRHIVSAVDLTVASAVAMETVLDLVRRTGARLTLVHALKNVAQPMAFSGGEAIRTRKNLEAQAAQMAQRLRAKIPHDMRIRVETRVSTADPHRAILDTAAEVDADLIVMGVPPRARLDEVVFGSTLKTVLRRTTIPLLVLPVVVGAHKWLDDADGVELALTARSKVRRI